MQINNATSKCNHHQIMPGRMQIQIFMDFGALVFKQEKTQNMCQTHKYT